MKDYIFKIGVALVALSLFGCSEKNNNADPSMGAESGAPLPPGGVLLRKSLGNISFLGTSTGLQSSIETDEGYSISLFGSFPSDVRVGDWIEVILASRDQEGGPRFLCTKFTEYCLRINSMHKISNETTPPTEN